MGSRFSKHMKLNLKAVIRNTTRLETKIIVLYNQWIKGNTKGDSRMYPEWNRNVTQDIKIREIQFQQ